jgi:hypothetical protein
MSIKTDLNDMIDTILGQYPNMTREQIRQMFADAAQVYLAECRHDAQHSLGERELSLLDRFQHID